ncbi:metal ABC transporter ATPase [Pedobacter antarcticus 4BY]|uniref:P-type Zn(2+) transporter n=2 Tax=Pedobacter antarcticus TaxID=34086 RepID=A0A081PGS5_9SPHI|nr:heavy metal translocating P-type ATPase [Pedobacter antarcticus]KEQ29898.1 metal ABC transporter ATPase [Pedobacter antarcticus 4BY]SFF43826.1 Cd2+/Zn2+-exporting ATPase [Pedobacter antarcticus]
MEVKKKLELEEQTKIVQPDLQENLQGDGHNNSIDEKNENSIVAHWDLLLALLILVIELVAEFGFGYKLNNLTGFIVNAVAYVLAGRGVLNLAYRKAIRGDFFNEFVLMSVATLGAFYIGEYSEGVAVMVFYQIGEWFQDAAVNRAKRNIKALLDIRPDIVTVIRDGVPQTVNPLDVKLGETIQIKPGEKVALDGVLKSDSASFNTAALTGESKPDTKYKADLVFAGMVNLNTVSEVQVSSLFKDSKLSKILEMVQDATARKSKTQLFISRFAKIYTPIVFFLALALVLLPFFFVSDYIFNDWLYRGLVFLVISCPCALVVSIPLGYFGGIGLASRNGILFKGGNFLDVMTQVNTVVMDKTGTLTKGVFKVQQVVAKEIGEEELVRITAALEINSTHPVGKAVVDYAGNLLGNITATDVEEIPGHGLKGIVEEKKVLVGNLKLLKKFKIVYPEEIERIAYTIIVVAVNDVYVGYITIADEIKEDAAEAIKQMHRLNIKTVMLSGDKQAVVDEVAKELGIDAAYGDLLPEDKVNKVQGLKDQGLRIAFAGDGVNDAPVIALADVGIAMGGLGSDATIETADVVIQNDQPSRIVSAIKAGKITRHIVWQNITMAMVVKVIVLGLGAGGVANLWEAVIADVGVALLAILNAVRIQRMNLK